MCPITRAEIVAGYNWLERARERAQAHIDAQPARTHTILEGGLVEERVYEHGRLVDIRRFTLGGGDARFHGPRYGGRRLA